MAKKSAKTSKIAIRHTERRLEALTLRKAGLSYERIGQVLGCTRVNAYLLVAHELEALQRQSREVAEQIRELELQRLDAMHMGVWQAAVKGDGDAIDRVLKIMDRRAKYLSLDAPTKVAPTNGTGTGPAEMTVHHDDFSADFLSEVLGILATTGALECQPPDGARPPAPAE